MTELIERVARAASGAFHSADAEWGDEDMMAIWRRVASGVIDALEIENWCPHCHATSPNDKTCGNCGSSIYQRIRT